MKRVDEFNKIKILEKEELIKINGGDDFLHDIGYLFGKVTRKIWETAKQLAQLDWSGSPLGY